MAAEASAAIDVQQRPSLGPTFLRAMLVPGRAGPTGQLPDRTLRWVSGVDRGDLTAYQRLCGFKVNDRLPHTYPHLLSFRLQALLFADKAFPLPMAGVVHISNEITARRELMVDDELTVEVSMRGFGEHRRGVTIDFLTKVSVAGDVAWESCSTYLHRTSTKPSVVLENQTEEPPPLPQREAAVWRLPADLGRQYAKVSGDVNPIHMSGLTAKLFGFPRAIAHGMCTYARTLAALGDDVNGPGRSQVWFRKPVLLPASVALRTSEDLRVAALTGAKDPERVHLILQRSTLG
ncbi:MaoC/PaaZ C-terminal domain-containing protein [Parenemella sanctibonifatiensis]|uniref:MaoC-like domain-containing protein n=1 Tax=Parenemella sanctibonifatiensis TaxID=2016505 RepID=A0A255EH42_9ACTN|nr:MaoC/PaaZ C-terminal domain-containing protein [Parenemella sanctibonifatiensis]OYN90846.1 hypothetical protein CGZ91_04930 [Parenemella sanctibonifatiensis]